VAVQPTYPGVYIEELPSAVRTITGVATSITAFVGFARRGPIDTPVRVQGFAEFEREFGGLWAGSTMSYAVQHFFLNGGSDALIVRAVRRGGDDAAARTAMTAGGFRLAAASPGAWGNTLRFRVDHDTRAPADAKLFNLSVTDTDSGRVEVFRNLSTDATASRFARRVLEEESKLVRITALGANRPNKHTDLDPGEGPFDDPAKSDTIGNNGTDGPLDNPADLLGEEDAKTGLFALERADLFNLLCIPAPDPETPLDAPGILQPAAEYCQKRRAVLILDPPPAWDEASDVVGGLAAVAVGDNGENAALYFPRLRMPDPLKENRLETFPPSGAVAGVIARTDAERGVWKAPAGQEAQLNGVAELSVNLTDGENGQLNPLGVNCLRNFAVAGNVVWGARTRDGADQLASQWKYLPVRRLALFIEESLYRGTQWVVFEPNDEPLWSQIRLNVGAFMHSLFRQGAFQGTSAREAYLVKCDKETTTQDDRNRGIVNVVVGFAPLKPAEFVIIKITQLAGQIES
jgi:phage tail sheath protein FI